MLDADCLWSAAHLACVPTGHPSPAPWAPSHLHLALCSGAGSLLPGTPALTPPLQQGPLRAQVRQSRRSPQSLSRRSRGGPSPSSCVPSVCTERVASKELRCRKGVERSNNSQMFVVGEGNRGAPVQTTLNVEGPALGRDLAQHWILGDPGQGLGCEVGSPACRRRSGKAKGTVGAAALLSPVA